MAEEIKTEKKKSKLAILGWIVMIIFIHIIIIFLLKTFGKLGYPTIILLMFLSWLIIGFIWFLIYYFISRKKTSQIKTELTKEEAMRIAREELYTKSGLKSIKTLENSVVAIGDDFESKERYFLWIFLDHIDKKLMYAYYMNLKNLGIVGEMPSLEYETFREFKERVIQSMNATSSPIKEKNTFVREVFDATGTLIGRTTGVTPTPIQQTQEIKKDEVDVK